MADAPPSPDFDERHARRLALLADVAAGTGPFLDRLRRALAQATDLLGYECGVLAHTRDGRHTVFVTHDPSGALTPGTASDLGDNYCSLTLDRDDLFEVDNMGDSAHSGHACYARLGYESYVGVPVRVDDEVWGVLCFYSTEPRSVPLTEPDRDLVRLIAVWIGGVMERDVRDHRLALEAGRLHDVVDQAPLVVYGLDAEGRFTLSMGQALSTLGMEPGEVVGQSLFELYEHDEVTVACVRRLLDGEPQSWETTIGEARFISQARPVRGPDGSVTGVIGVSLDITDLARSREALAESEARSHALADATFEGIAFVDDGQIIDANDQLARLLGYDSGADLVGQDARLVAADEDRATIDRMIAEGHAEPYEVVCVRRDGSRFWAEIQGRLVKYDGRTVRIKAIRDVTARKRAEEQRRFQADVLAHVSDAVVALDLDGRIAYWNAGAEELHGLDHDDVIGRPLADVVTYVLPASGTVADHAEAALLSDAARDGELIFVGPDGRRRFVSVSSSVLYDEHGAERGLLAVSRDVTARRRMAARLRHQATHDDLTGLPNRTLFRDRIEDAVEAGAPFAVLFIDLDHFKVVNDSLGHGAGDRLLMEVAQRLTSAVAQVDGAVIARLGGDEFGALVPSRHSDPARVGEAMLRALAEPVDLGARALPPEASIGVVAHGERYATTEALLRDADTAMYAAKRAGRGRLTVFTDEMHEAASMRFGLEHDLRFAAARGQIRPYYQPIVDLSTGAVSGFEALIRWEHPEMGLLAPGRFLPLAEEIGLVPDLDRWVLDRTCAEVAGWGREAIDALAYVSVNCSDATFLAPGLIRDARAAVDLSGLPPDRLVLELTERAAVDVEAARSVIAQAHQCGLSVAIDDFGAGYSSLGLLHALPVDAVKIDRSFVDGVAEAGAGRAVVRAVVGLSQELGMRSIAEGIETPHQLRALREAGATMGQGYLFSPPVPGDQARTMLARPPWADDWPVWTRNADLVTA